MAKKIKKTRENLKEMNVNELRKQAASLEENMRVIRFKAEGSKSKNVKEYASLKKDIARVLTFINQKNAK